MKRPPSEDALLEEKRIQRCQKFDLIHWLRGLSAEQLLELIQSAVSKDEDGSVEFLLKSEFFAPLKRRRLLIRNIPFTTTEGSLKGILETYGPIEDFTILKDVEGASRGFGFVTFESFLSVESCLASMPIVMNGRELKISPAGDKPERSVQPHSNNQSGNNAVPTANARSWKVFVRNIPPGTTSSEVEKCMRRFGDLENVAIVTHGKDADDGPMKTFAFVQFKHSQDALRAVDDEGTVSIRGQLAFLDWANETKRQRTYDWRDSAGGGDLVECDANDTIQRSTPSASSKSAGRCAPAMQEIPLSAVTCGSNQEPLSSGVQQRELGRAVSLAASCSPSTSTSPLHAGAPIVIVSPANGAAASFAASTIPYAVAAPILQQLSTQPQPSQNQQPIAAPNAPATTISSALRGLDATSWITLLAASNPQAPSVVPPPPGSMQAQQQVYLQSPQTGGSSHQWRGSTVFSSATPAPPPPPLPSYRRS